MDMIRAARDEYWAERVAKNDLVAARRPKMMRGDVTFKLPVALLTPGMRVDLEADPTTRDMDATAFVYATVADVEWETVDCVRVDFDNFPSFGFSPEHMVTVVTTV